MCVQVEEWNNNLCYLHCRFSIALPQGNSLQGLNLRATTESMASVYKFGTSHTEQAEYNSSSSYDLNSDSNDKDYTCEQGTCNDTPSRPHSPIPSDVDDYEALHILQSGRQ